MHLWRKHGSLSKSPGNQWQLGFRPTPLGLCQRARVVERDVHVVLVRNRGWQGMLSNNKTTKAKEKRGNGQKRGEMENGNEILKKGQRPCRKSGFSNAVAKCQNLGETKHRASQERRQQKEAK